MTASSVAVEHVLVVPTSLFHKLGHFQGFSSDTKRYLTELLKPENASYLPRGRMEIDPNYKQLIPYVLFRYRDSAGRVCVFQYTRGKGQGESRLPAMRSIGIGGHISSEDRTCKSPYEEGMRRELAEEVQIDTPYRAGLVGLINDDQTAVGKVHLGIVHIFDVEKPLVKALEPDIIEAGFQPVEKLNLDLAQFETWSQICLKALFL
jgi:predicted NUDIX family phosphoesterase